MLIGCVEQGDAEAASLNGEATLAPLAGLEIVTLAKAGTTNALRTGSVPRITLFINEPWKMDFARHTLAGLQLRLADSAPCGEQGSPRIIQLCFGLV